MNQFRTAAGRAFAEVRLLKQQYIKVTAGGVHCDSNACRTSANDDDVPRSCSISHSPDGIVTAQSTGSHESDSHARARRNASAHRPRRRSTSSRGIEG